MPAPHISDTHAGRARRNKPPVADPTSAARLAESVWDNEGGSIAPAPGRISGSEAACAAPEVRAAAMPPVHSPSTFAR